MNTTGCYLCGSADGTPTRLCKECTAKRLKEREAKKGASSGSGARAAESTAAAEEPKTTGALTSTIKFDQDAPLQKASFRLTKDHLMLGGFILVAVGVVYLLVFSRFGLGLGVPRADKVYERCLDQLAGKVRGAINGSAMVESGSKLNSKQSSADLMEGVATSVCEEMRTECAKNPGGKACQDFIATFK